MKYNEIFKRNIGIFTHSIQRLIKNSTIAIAGVGGVGGIQAVTFARMGVGNLKIADPEFFDFQDFNRQYGAQKSNLGKKKLDVIEGIIKDINPKIKLQKFPEGVNKENLESFLEGADVVVDAIDYNAPLEKLEMYRRARQRNLYVLTSPIGGLGTLVMCFNPKGMTVEEAFEYPVLEEEIKKHRLPLKKLIGCELDYVSPLFYETQFMKEPYFSTNSAAASIAGGFVPIEAIKIIIKRDKEKHPRKHKHLKEINVIDMPYCRRIDIWDSSKDGIINIKEV